MALPQTPVPIGQFLQYTRDCTSHSELIELVKPFKAYESKLREIYAQHPDHPAVKSSHLVPIFTDAAPLPLIRARNLDNESSDVKDHYLLALEDETRRPHGSPATVKSLSEFRFNFNLFCESSLADLDWNNVIAAGSSVVTALLPVDAPLNQSKRALRTHYHQTLAPASDVDLFLYGLDEEQALEKIKQIETKVKDSILAETTTIRTKNAITIVSEYPTRHVQIVLRLYKSKSEVLTGFDVDCACVAYDGQQVWATPRALTAFMTQVNMIDLTRRSPSYENRLSKYAHRGFEVYWPALDRSRIDPTIFERSFARVKGLARLLVLEKLPHPLDRDTYLAKRRKERGRPPLPWNARYRHQLAGNVKDSQPDDVAEWVDESEVSNYHTFTIPYGPKYNAQRIEKLVFTKDLLLNAEWNRPKDRETKLHRHPAFFGRLEDIIGDCCGSCPKPQTDEDLKVFEEESVNYISGEIKFLKDDPGRQEIGSFHPIRDEDWTEMAYVGNTTRLCQAIIDKDLEAVEDWFSSGDPEEVLDVNRRDHVGRTPLLLAAMASTPEIVQLLIEKGARLVSRLYNGMTALHFAAHRGETEMIRMLLSKSESNEEAQARKEETKKAARRSAAIEPLTDVSQADDSDDGIDSVDDDPSDALTEGSFVKVSELPTEMVEDDLDEPDVYDINVLAWDQPMSPLHLAIISGKIEAVKLLVTEFGADVLLPVKIVDKEYRREPIAAILTLVLALEAPLRASKEMVETLLSLGARTTQADMNERSALQLAISQAKEIIISTMVSKTEPDRLRKVVNHTSPSDNSSWYDASVVTPLVTAVRTRDATMVQKLLDLGAEPAISFEAWQEVVTRSEKKIFSSYRVERTADTSLSRFRRSVQQPVIVAAKLECPEIVSLLLDAGASPNTLPSGSWSWLENHGFSQEAKSLLDLVRDHIRSLEDSLANRVEFEKPQALVADKTYLDFPEGSYKHWTATHDLIQAKIVKKVQMNIYNTRLERRKHASEEEKTLARESLERARALETKLVGMYGRTFYDLCPLARAPEKAVKDDGGAEDSYKTSFSFQIPGLNEEMKQAYLSLFEAAFAGDVETVKSLCLDSRRPLLVGVRDLAGFSPFTLAVLQGHYDLATTILDIATVQYRPANDEPRYRYRLGKCADDSDASEDDDSESPQLIQELVDGNFTVEDITTLADNVKSDISPQHVLDSRSGVWRAFGGKAEAAMEEFGLEQEHPRYNVNRWECSEKTSRRWFNKALPLERERCNQSLVRYAVAKNDMKMLRFLIAAGRKLNARKDDDWFGTRSYTIRQDDFEFALQRGRTEMIGEIIQATGHVMPLDEMVAGAGAKVEAKPYYQGLTVYGRKRKDWAEQERGAHKRDDAASREDNSSQLLKAVFQGNLHSTEYYLSDGPLNRYVEFATAHGEDDKRIQGLEQLDGGLHSALGKWLSARSELAAHMAVMAKPVAKGNPLLEYVLKAVPGSLNAKSLNGSTPLLVAFQLGRIESARILIQAGADQGARDNYGANVLHVLFKHRPLRDCAKLIGPVLQLLDREVVQSLLLQKYNNPHLGPMTPLALCLLHDEPDKTVLRTILDYSRGKDLSIMNGTGDYVLHTLVRAGKAHLVKFLVEGRPEILWQENASGLTPIEVAWVARLQYMAENAPDLSGSQITGGGAAAKSKLSEDEREMRMLLHDLDEDELKAAKSRRWYMLYVLEKLAEKFPGKRKLVSLFEANEVARRLAREQRKRNEETRRQERLGLKVTGMRFRERYQDHGRGKKTMLLNDEGVWVCVENDEDEVDHWQAEAQGFWKADQVRLLEKTA